MPETLPFINPYRDVPEANLKRLTTNISKTDWEFIKRIHMVDGVWNTTLNTLLVKLINELKRRNITDYASCDEFTHFVANCTIAGPEQVAIAKSDITIIAVKRPNGTTDRTVRNADALDDRGTASSESHGDTTAPNITPNLPSGVAKRSRRGSKKQASESEGAQ